MSDEYVQIEIDLLPRLLADRWAQVGVSSDSLSVQEIGDGNLNRVFRLRDASGSSAIVKQALPYLRVDTSWKLSRHRIVNEARVHAEHLAADPEHLPRIFVLDEDLSALLMEDLGHLQLVRDSRDAAVHATAASAVGRYIARCSQASSLLALTPTALRKKSATFQNSELCAISERLVFTEPFTMGHPHNTYPEALEGMVKRLTTSPHVTAAAYDAYELFVTSREALIHGDLHAGSVMSTATETKVIDFEFGCYGPIGFDLGTYWASEIIEAAVQRTHFGSNDVQPRLDLVNVTWNAFASEWARGCESVDNGRPRPTDTTVSRILGESVLFTAVELTRRAIGFAKAANVSTLEPQARETATIFMLEAAASLFDLSRSRSVTVADLVAALETVRCR